MRDLVSILVILLLLIKVNFSQAQTKIYVWNFVNEQEEEDGNTKTISEEFETQLSAYPDNYTLVNRKGFAESVDLRKWEKKISLLNDSNKTILTQLRILHAEIVVFGTIVPHKGKRSEIFTFHATFQNVETLAFTKKRLNIPKNILQGDIEKLQVLISDFVCSLIRGKQCDQDVIKDSVKSPNSVLSPNKFKFGVRVGLNLANPFETKLENSKTLKMIPTYHIGGIVAYKLSKAFSLESGLLLSGKGAKLEEAYTSGAIWCTSTISPLYLEIPLNLLYSFDLGHAKMCLFGGGYVGIGISGKIKSESANDYGSIFDLYNESMNIRFGSTADSHLKPADFGFNIGTSIEIKKNFFFRAQYDMDLAGMDLKNWGAEKVKSGVMEFSIGYMFGII